MKKSNKFLTLLIICGVLLFAVIAFFFIRATATVTAVVPTQEIVSGTRIEENMITTIQVPKNTPKGYITDKSSLIGQKLKVTVNQNQLLYINNIMTSWDDFNSGKPIPNDYIVTSIQLPANRAVGGLITAGDYVDILGVPNGQYSSIESTTLDSYLGDMAKNSYGNLGIKVYWVLSNVLILETDSTLSQNDHSSISGITEEENSGEGDFYIVALSYDDYKKLRLSEQYLNLWMNIAPEQNSENPPLLSEMSQSIIEALEDSQAQSKMNGE